MSVMLWYDSNALFFASLVLRLIQLTLPPIVGASFFRILIIILGPLSVSPKLLDIVVVRVFVGNVVWLINEPLNEALVFKLKLLFVLV